MSLSQSKASTDWRIIVTKSGVHVPVVVRNIQDVKFFEL